MRKADGQRLASTVFKTVESNFSRLLDRPDGLKQGRSKENWRVHCQKTVESTPKKLEVYLERRLVDASGKGSNWWNQMPVASGLVRPRCDRRRCLDLVCEIE